MAGLSWQAISPDLTGYKEKEEEEAKPDPDKPRPPAITTLAASEVQPGVMWAGTSNRIVQLTRDAGATWQNVSPPGLTEPTQILAVEASHHDAATAYVAAGATRYSTPPYVVRTHDYGRTWQKIVNGFPEREMVRVVREDPKRKGLLYAGTDTGVFVSWDDGDHWQSLQLNLPRDAGHRSPGTRQRSGHLNLRTCVVDSGRRHAAARDQPADHCQRRLPVSSGHRYARAMGQLSGHALPGRNSRRAESARWSHPRLLPEVGADRRNHADDLRRQGRRGCSVLQHSEASGPSSRERSQLLVCARGSSAQSGGCKSLCLESSLSASAFSFLRLQRRTAGIHRIHDGRPRDRGADSACATSGTVRCARELHARAACRRPDTPATVDHRT